MARIFVVQLLLGLGFATAAGNHLQHSVARHHCQDNEKPCGNICYSPHRHEECCNDIIFDDRQKICCGTNLININDQSIGCCGGRQFDQTEEICCSGISHSRFHWRDGLLVPYQMCCGGVPLDDRTHQCCEDHHHHTVVWDMREREANRNYSCCNYQNGSIKAIDTHTETCPDFGLCGETMYNRDQSYCCQDRLLHYRDYSGGLARSNAGCCNGSLYNYYENSCCFDEYLTRLREREICCASSPRGKIDGRTQLCCATGPLTNTSASQKCCHDRLIDSNSQGCCHNPTLNSYATFNLSTSICCEGQVVPKATKCCTDRWLLQDGQVCCPKGRPINVSDSQQKCCEGDYGRQVFDPRTQTCTEGIVARRLSCGGPGKICCQGVEHDAHGGEAQCCARGINSYFTRNQTCCDGSVYNGSNLACCGGRICTHTDTCPGSFSTRCGQNCLTNGQSICCSGQVHPFSPQRRKCCGRLTYQDSRQRCVNGQVVGLKMCTAQKCGGKLKGGVGCGSTNDSVLVFEGAAKKLKGKSTVTFRDISQLDKCGRRPPKKIVYPKQIEYETPKNCHCNLKNRKKYMIVVKNYRQNQFQNQTYRLGTEDLVLGLSLENLVRIKQKNPSPSKSKRIIFE